MQAFFKVYVTKDYLKFSAAHFIAYPGFREALHGHNYRVSVEITGELGTQGYVLDFGIVKKTVRKLCKQLNEKMIVPMESDCLDIREEAQQVILRYEEDEFRFPRADAALLPIIHSSAEELARYLTGELKRALPANALNGLHSIEVGVEETTGQSAFYREDLTCDNG